MSAVGGKFTVHGRLAGGGDLHTAKVPSLWRSVFFKVRGCQRPDPVNRHEGR